MAKDGDSTASDEMCDPVMLVNEIDLELHKCHPTQEQYMAKARSILFSLMDKREKTSKYKRLVGFLKSSDVLSSQPMTWRAMKR